MKSTTSINPPPTHRLPNITLSDSLFQTRGDISKPIPLWLDTTFNGMSLHEMTGTKLPTIPCEHTIGDRLLSIPCYARLVHRKKMHKGRRKKKKKGKSVKRGHILFAYTLGVDMEKVTSLKIVVISIVHNRDVPFYDRQKGWIRPWHTAIVKKC